jgi:hypothetical protein
LTATQLANGLHDYQELAPSISATSRHGDRWFGIKERTLLKGFLLAEFLLRGDVCSMKKELIAAHLTLTDGESAKAWQAYEQYSEEMNKINGRKTAILKEYSQEYYSLTDDQAGNLIRRWLETDIEQAKLRHELAGSFGKILPGKKAATFLQLERLISMMMEVQLTSELPLAESEL